MIDSLGNPQSALVLGGGSEIALATVEAMMTRRLRTVVLAGRDVGALSTHAGRLREMAGNDVEVEVEAFDALDPSSHHAVVDAVFDRHDIDVVLLAFGVLGSQDEAERSTEEAVRVTATNYVGAVSVGLAVAERMRRAGHGAIIVLSSVAGERARRANFVYGSSKAGLDAFAQGLSDSLHGSGVSVMVVRPGFVHTAMTRGQRPAPLAVAPAAVASAIIDGMAKGATIVYVPASLRWIFLVLRHLPTAIFRMIPR